MIKLSGKPVYQGIAMGPAAVLTPSETVQMDKEKILAFVTVHGSADSHTSILARMMNIPALIGVPVNLNEIRSGMTVMVDGFRGEAVFEPSEEIGMAARERIQKEQEIFCTQLRALLRAAVYGNLSVMYPMITSVDEVTKIYEIVERVKEELDTNGIPYKVPEQGIMIETPAAVMISDELAEKVDFFSIGTNDLTQYTLAVDRQNERLDDFYNPHHRAILKMIQMVVDNAHIAGKWAGICGELGADPKLTKRFIDMGIDELSVAPSMILPLREIVREI
jgi:phosphoenolpyruvate-protein kinase (PTS system EI component)